MIKKSDLHLETFPTGPLGCNCTIISSPQTSEAIIIDPGQDANKLLKMITAKKIKPTILLHTHAHFDHIGESAEIKQKTGAKICLHSGDQFLYDALSEQGAFFGFRLNPPGVVDEKIQDGQNLGFNSVEDKNLKKLLEVIHTPGHTPGSCSFYLETDQGPILFSGDTLFQNSIGRTDLPGGNFDQIVKSIKNRLYQKLPDETLVIPGHGPNTTIFNEKKHNPFIKGQG